MPAQALYLKYRPRSFGEIEGQEHIAQTLKNALALGRVSHAYLFTGPRGTGKTTTARILAKAVNCLAEKDDGKPDNTCANCRAINEDRMLDLIEIDAASHTSVDDVRDLRDKIDFRPGEAKFKVYIIDEVHMLSTSAFNALLKTLEEPPPHVIFVLATTDPQKIPATVISRVQRFDFRRLTIPEIITRLKEIAAKENLKVDAPVFDVIARHSSGAMRDAISLLDQLASFGSGEVTLAMVERLLGSASREAVSKLVAALAAKDVAQGIGLISAAVDGGADPRQLAREIVEYLRGLLMGKTGNAALLAVTAETQKEIQDQSARFSISEILRVTRLFNQAAWELRASANPTLPLELAFVEAVEGPVVPKETVVPELPRRDEPKQSVAFQTPRAPVKPESESAAQKKSDAPIGDGALTVQILNAHWARVIERVKLYNKTIAAMVRDTEFVKIEGDLVVLGFHYEAHAQRFETQADGKALIERSLREVFGTSHRVKCVLSPKKAKLKAVEQDPLVQAARNLGGIPKLRE